MVSLCLRVCVFSNSTEPKSRIFTKLCMEAMPLNSTNHLVFLHLLRPSEVAPTLTV